MMINKRLIGTVAESKKYIAGNVILQWCSLTANIALMLSISRMLAELFRGSASVQLFTVTGIVVIWRWQSGFLLHRGHQNGGTLLQSSQKVFA